MKQIRRYVLIVVAIALAATGLSAAAGPHVGQKGASGSAAVVELIALENTPLSAERAGENPLLRYEIASGSPVAARVLPRLEISASKYPELAQNIRHAQQAGHPSVLTHGGNAAANRAAALDGVPNIRGLSRDEYPFASSMQGGGGSWVGHIPAGQQQAQGGLITDFLRRTGIKAGDQYEVVIAP